MTRNKSDIADETGIRALVEQFGRELPCDPAPNLPWRDKLAVYLERLTAYNRRFNLVGPGDARTILATLIPDSFHLASLLGRLPLPQNPHALDCGAGGGLPGIPLRMLWQAGIYTLVEQRKKRALFLENALAELALPNTRVLAGDAFRFPGRADIILSRAWMPIPNVLDFCEEHLRPGGFAILFANNSSPEIHAPFEKFAQADYDSPTGPRAIWAVRHGDRL